jgi:hypothetical protein
LVDGSRDRWSDFFGSVFLKNNAEPAKDDNLEQEVGPPEDRAKLRSRLTNEPEEFREDRGRLVEGDGEMIPNRSLLLGVAIGLFGALAVLTARYVAVVLAG